MAQKDSTLTQEQLKDILDYNPDTGVFTWLVNRGRNKTKDCVAGCEHTANSKKYLIIKISYQPFKAHRLAVLYMTGSFPEFDTDHDDGNGLNNKWCNLQAVTRIENNKNKRLQSNNTSGCAGVRWRSVYNKWESAIVLNTKNIYLGRFDNIFDAACARKSAENKHNFNINHGSVRPL